MFVVETGNVDATILDPEDLDLEILLDRG